MTTINEKLKLIREKAELIQEQIAKFIGVSQTYISKVENGERNLTVDQLESIANLYGYSLDLLVNADQDIQPIQFAFDSQEANCSDLRAIADIGKIITNHRLMTRLLEV